MKLLKKITTEKKVRCNDCMKEFREEDLLIEEKKESWGAEFCPYCDSQGKIQFIN